MLNYNISNDGTSTSPIMEGLLMIADDVETHFILLWRLLPETICVGNIASDIELCMDFHTNCV